MHHSIEKKALHSKSARRTHSDTSSRRTHRTTSSQDEHRKNVCQQQPKPQHKKHTKTKERIASQLHNQHPKTTTTQQNCVVITNHQTSIELSFNVGANFRFLRGRQEEWICVMDVCSPSERRN
jgi:hypothetical protein